MTDPSDEEINKTIAEFMGFHKIVLTDYETPDCLYCEICGPEVDVLKHPFLEPHPCNIQTIMPDKYTSSLDALSEVWSKMNRVDIVMQYNRKGFRFCSLTHHRCEPESHEIFNFIDTTTARAAARATYFAIKELG